MLLHRLEQRDCARKRRGSGDSCLFCSCRWKNEGTHQQKVWEAGTGIWISSSLFRMTTSESGSREAFVAFVLWPALLAGTQHTLTGCRLVFSCTLYYHWKNNRWSSLSLFECTINFIRFSTSKAVNVCGIWFTLGWLGSWLCFCWQLLSIDIDLWLWSVGVQNMALSHHRTLSIYYWGYASSSCHPPSPRRKIGRVLGISFSCCYIWILKFCPLRGVHKSASCCYRRVIKIGVTASMYCGGSTNYLCVSSIKNNLCFVRNSTSGYHSRKRSRLGHL